VSRWLIPFSRQTRSNSTSTGCGRVCRPVNCLPLNIGEHLERHPVAAHRRGERLADGPARRHRHHGGDHHEPRMVIDAGDHLGFAAISQRHPADQVQLPQLHRRRALPPLIDALMLLRLSGHQPL
jgi:hypothetical protein